MGWLTGRVGIGRRFSMRHQEDSVMDFELSEELTMLRETVRSFAKERISDHATNIAEDVILVAESVNLKHAEKLVS